MSVNPQKENGHIQIANEIWDEIIRRDFSKRQKDIMQLILRLSYGCNKKTAHIPLLKDFALCGVSPTQITSELKYLRMCKVIDWDRDDMIFAFNKNYEIWQVSPVKWWDDERFKQLLHINIANKTSQNMNFTKHELHEKRSLDFMKSEVGDPSIPCESKSEDVSKDSIKDSKETTTTADAYVESITDANKKVFGTLMLGGLVKDYVMKLLKEGYTEVFIVELMLETGESGNKPSLRLMQTIGERWIKEGIYTRVESKRRHDEEKKKSSVSNQYSKQEAPKEYVPDPNILRMLREAN
jgi:hypothetical protein